MSAITLLSNGALHPDLLNGSFVKYIGSQNQNQNLGQTTGVQLSFDPTAMEQKAKEFTETLHRNGAISLDNIASQNGAAKTDTYVPSASDASGKTIIDNRADCGLIVETIQYGVTTPSDANKSAAAGGATHGFFYHTTDFLMDAAERYATLGENEEFMFRGINDVNFVRDTLDFFTNGSYTEKDVAAMQDQMTSIVEELAQQIKDGKAPDIDQVKTTLTIGDAEVSLSKLLDMQQMGRKLSQSFDDISFGSLYEGNIQSFAEMGIAKAMADQYGEGQGALGAMFSNAMDRLYEKGVSQVERANQWVTQYCGKGGSIPANSEAVKVELEIADLFSNMEEDDFSETLSNMRDIVSQYCQKYGLTTSHVGLAGATVGVEKAYQAFQNIVGQYAE